MDGESVWSALLEALPTLILHSIPYGISNLVEIEQRMASWEQRLRNEEGFTALTYRINTQEEAKNRDHIKETESEKRSKRIARAKRLATEGAYSKAVQGMDGGTKILDTMQQIHY
eukprot:15436361-Heterocapsa_arctica.AAC.1